MRLRKIFGKMNSQKSKATKPNLQINLQKAGKFSAKITLEKTDYFDAEITGCEFEITNFPATDFAFSKKLHKNSERLKIGFLARKF